MKAHFLARAVDIQRDEVHEALARLRACGRSDTDAYIKSVDADEVAQCFQTIAARRRESLA